MEARTLREGRLLVIEWFDHCSLHGATSLLYPLSLTEQSFLHPLWEDSPWQNKQGIYASSSSEYLRCCLRESVAVLHLRQLQHSGLRDPGSFPRLDISAIKDINKVFEKISKLNMTMNALPILIPSYGCGRGHTHICMPRFFHPVPLSILNSFSFAHGLCYLHIFTF